MIGKQVGRLILAALTISACGITAARANVTRQIVPNWTQPFDRIYVAESTSVHVLNSKYWRLGSIKNGIVAAQNVWVDQKQDLYVANAPGYSIYTGCATQGNVVEFAPDGFKPVFTYSNGLVCPVQTTTDQAGNVYVSDAGPNSPYTGGSGAAFVVEYAHRTNTILATFTAAGCLQNEFFSPHPSLLAVINGELAYACSFTGIRGVGWGGLVSGNVFGGIADAFGDLILPVQAGGGGPVCPPSCGLPPSIQVIAPGGSPPVQLPYLGFSSPNGAALSRDEKLLFVADPGNSQVVILNYPSGTLVGTLGASKGINYPVSVAVAPPKP